MKSEMASLEATTATNVSLKSIFSLYFVVFNAKSADTPMKILSYRRVEV